MSTIPFNPEKELKVLGYYPAPGPKKTPYFDTPILPKENLKLALEGKDPLWFPIMPDIHSVSPACIPDNIARGFMTENRKIEESEKGGLDMFGLDWEWVSLVGGSTVRPGKPLFDDANDWKKALEGRIPDPDQWGWKENIDRIECLFDDRRMRRSVILTGFFERLISFMNFDNALLALIDEDQKEAVHEVFDMLCGVYEKIIRNLIKYAGIEMLEIHDDWGSQRAPLFSIETIREMILPHIKKTVDFCKSQGIPVSFHCCGKNETLVPAMIEAGFCMWVPQVVNDIDYIIKTYGDKMVIGINPHNLKPGMTDEEIIEKAHELVAKYADTPRVLLFKSPSRHTTPEYELYFNEVYAESRRVLAEKNK